MQFIEIGIITYLSLPVFRNSDFARYYESGKLRETGFYTNGTQDGEWKEFHENGKLKSVGIYKIEISG